MTNDFLYLRAKKLKKTAQNTKKSEQNYSVPKRVSSITINLYFEYYEQLYWT